MTHQIILNRDQEVPTFDDNDQEIRDIDLIVESKSVLETPLTTDETRQWLSGPREDKKS